jgi:hypothetical protein
MGGTMSKSQKLDTIKTGRIQYKDAQIQEVSVRFVGTTAILLNTIRLVAVVGGNEVVNPFNDERPYQDSPNMQGTKHRRAAWSGAQLQQRARLVEC